MEKDKRERKQKPNFTHAGFTYCDLYSDVNPAIYKRVGWTEYPAPYVSINALDFAKSSKNFSNSLCEISLLSLLLNRDAILRVSFLFISYSSPPLSSLLSPSPPSPLSSPLSPPFSPLLSLSPLPFSSFLSSFSFLYSFR